MYDLFVSCPYTDPQPEVVAQRVQLVEAYVAGMAKKGFVAYSPIAAWHHMLDNHELPSDYEFWKKHCRQMVGSARRVHVLCLPGWSSSAGVQDEIDAAVEQNVPIAYIDPHGHRQELD